MTRKAPQPVWKAIGWYGEPDGRAHEFIVTLPERLRDRYRVTGRLRFVSDRPVTVPILSVTMTDRETGVTVRKRGDRTTIALSQAATPDYVKGLWAAAREILGLAQRQVGRPPGTGVIRNDDEIWAVVIEMRRCGTKNVTEKTVAAFSGTFTVDNLRAYLRRTGRTWRAFLHT